MPTTALQTLEATTAIVAGIGIFVQGTKQRGGYAGFSGAVETLRGKARCSYSGSNPMLDVNFIYAVGSRSCFARTDQRELCWARVPTPI